MTIRGSLRPSAISTGPPEELLGYPASNWMEDPEFWLKVIHPEDREFAASYRRKQLKQGLDHEGEYRVVARDGRFLWFREAVRIVRSTPEGPAAFCGLMFDISRRKKVERQLYTAKGELASQLREMSYLHELGRRAGAGGELRGGRPPQGRGPRGDRGAAGRNPRRPADLAPRRRRPPRADPKAGRWLRRLIQVS